MSKYGIDSGLQTLDVDRYRMSSKVRKRMETLSAPQQAAASPSGAKWYEGGKSKFAFLVSSWAASSVVLLLCTNVLAGATR